MKLIHQIDIYEREDGTFLARIEGAPQPWGMDSFEATSASISGAVKRLMATIKDAMDRGRPGPKRSLFGDQS